MNPILYFVIPWLILAVLSLFFSSRRFRRGLRIRAGLKLETPVLALDVMQNESFIRGSFFIFLMCVLNTLIGIIVYVLSGPIRGEAIYALLMASHATLVIFVLIGERDSDSMFNAAKQLLSLLAQKEGGE